MRYETYRSRTSRDMTARRKPKGGKVIPPEFQGKLKLDEKKEWIKREKPKKVNYPQNWSLYNLSQTKEKMMFLKLLNNAVDCLEIPCNYSFGRPSVPVDDMIKCCCIKVFNNFSSRRTIAELQLAFALGYIKKVYHFNTICKYMKDPSITSHLHDAYKLLASPLVDIENYFAIDASGLSTFNRKKWLEVRFDRKLVKDYKKLHIVSGVNTHVIISAQVTEGTRNDSPMLEGLIIDASKRFKIKEVYADAGYLSRQNCEAITQLGGVPYIMPKENSTPRAGRSIAWHSMIRLWKDNQQLFKKHYHQRSNAESVFSMLKRKYLPYVRSKSDTAQYNEILCKVVCHNASVLVNSIFELNVPVEFY